ncbi:hypothetical protein DFH27DRAFT_634948, partial [Peziza echinospora]
CLLAPFTSELAFWLFSSLAKSVTPDHTYRKCVQTMALLRYRLSAMWERCLPFLTTMTSWIVQLEASLWLVVLA